MAPFPSINPPIGAVVSPTTTITSCEFDKRPLPFFANTMAFDTTDIYIIDTVIFPAVLTAFFIFDWRFWQQPVSAHYLGAPLSSARIHTPCILLIVFFTTDYERYCTQKHDCSVLASHALGLSIVGGNFGTYGHTHDDSISTTLVRVSAR